MTLDIPKYKKFAFMQLQGRWKPAILGTLISILLLFIFSFFQSKAPSINYSELMTLPSEQLFTALQESASGSGVGFILELLNTIVDFIVEMVLVTFFLIFSRSPDPVSLKDYFEGYNKWTRAILCGLWKLLWTFLWGLLAIPLAVIFFIIISCFTNFDGSDAPVVNYTICIILLFIGFIPMFIKTIEYSFAFFFASEFPEIGIRKSLRLSITIAKGHRWEIFVLNISFIGWVLLSILTFCIGFLWTLPYYYMTLTNAYHALLQDALETGKIKPEELNS